jgi:DNA-binding NarL/FixJ family response regulator
MSFPSEAPSPPPVRRDRSIEARRDARKAKAERERRIVNLLNAGVSIDEIAAQERLSLKRMHNVVREILARRMPQPPAEFAALQVSR